MFGANKGLRDLGKDTTDYKNYDSAAEKTKRYKEQVYGKKTTTVYVNGNPTEVNTGIIKNIVGFMIVIFIFIFVIPIIEIVLMFMGIMDSSSVTGMDPEVNVNSNNENSFCYKYEDYDEEWVKDYFIALRQTKLTSDSYELFLVDTDFNNVPEMFLKFERQGVVKYFMYYHYNNEVMGEYATVQNLKLYKDIYNGNYVWGSLNMSSITDNAYFTRFDRVQEDISSYIETGINSLDTFYYKYTLVNVSPSSMIIYNVNEDYYDLVDLYLKNNDELNQKIN